MKHASGAHDEPETSDEVSIGHMYEYGESVPQDYATALHWYQLAALTCDTAAEGRGATSRAAPLQSPFSGVGSATAD